MTSGLDNALYYTFSTIAQTTAGLLGFLVAVLAFRLPSVSAKIQEAREMLSAHHRLPPDDPSATPRHDSREAPPDEMEDFGWTDGELRDVICSSGPLAEGDDPIAAAERLPTRIRQVHQDADHQAGVTRMITISTTQRRSGIVRAMVLQELGGATPWKFSLIVASGEITVPILNAQHALDFRALVLKIASAVGVLGAAAIGCSLWILTQTPALALRPNLASALLSIGVAGGSTTAIAAIATLLLSLRLDDPMSVPLVRRLLRRNMVAAQRRLQDVMQVVGGARSGTWQPWPGPVVRLP